jgi:NAD(P)H-flavin reductase
VATHSTPGQYIEVRAQGEKGYFALANEPSAPAWQLLMRSGGGASDVLLGMSPGDALEVTDAIGAGFPMTAARGRPLIVALSGTGVAAGGPIVGWRIAHGDAGHTHVFLGARTRYEVALQHQFELWSGAGVSVIVCLSQGETPEDAHYVRGYVQDVIRTYIGSCGLERAGALIFAVGMQSMIDALRALAIELGIRPEDVLTNH